MNKPFLMGLLLCLGFSAGAQQVIRLYPGAAPGSEQWTHSAKYDTIKQENLVMVTDVSVPTLTVYKAAHPTGTAMIVCPGGAFRLLALNKEGDEIAQWLNEKGITAFVLQYRLVPTTAWTFKEFMEDMQANNSPHIDAINAPYVPLAVADGREAVKFVRQHAAEYGVLPDRIGIMGFSAGGTLSASVAQTYDAASRPDFVAPIYAYTGAIMGDAVPADAPPMFLALASNDPIAFGNPDLYKKWRDAGRSAEMHIYPNGGHGFAMRKQYLSSDSWTDRFAEWLDALGLLMTPERAKSMAQYSAKDIAEWKEASEKRLHNDWAYMSRFREANKNVKPPKPGEKRVVFMGDSITEGWEPSDPGFFTGKPYIARGISGQTTPQMVLRFRQDVIDLKPAVVVILAGTNDIAGNTGPMTLEEIMGNIASMAQLAKANGIQVVLSSVLPAYDYPWKPGMQPVEKIAGLNAMIQAYAAKNNCTYLDYYTPMADQRKGLPLQYSEDGVHPNKAGYKVMGALAEKAIAEALKKAGK